MSSAVSRISSSIADRHPTLVGVFCCFVEALGYTAANVCLRQLTVLEADPALAIWGKELVTVLALGPVLALRAAAGQRIWPSARALAALVGVGLVVQLAGNLSMIWAFGVVGMAIATPAVFGVSLVACAALGRGFLAERLSPRSVLAIGLLIAAIVLLSAGTSTANRAVAPGTGQPIAPLWAALGFAAAGVAGGVFALLTVTVRGTVNGSASPVMIGVIVTGMGVVSLGPLSVWRLGLDALLGAPPEQWLWMFAAGVFNLIAFSGMINGLRFTTAVHANVISASQVALAAVAGMLLFHEPASPWLLLGVGLTIVGVVLFDRPVQTM